MADIQFTPFTCTYERNSVDDPETRIEEGISSLGRIEFRDKTVALAVGSRGIRCIAQVVRSTVAALARRGARTFIIPAMGSHGGATAEGQRELLAGYGITEEKVGAPIRASMETVELPSDGLQNRLFVDRIAWREADYIVPINRVKSHTDFSGPHESGILKMLVIGLGKHELAKEIHSYGLYGLRELIAPTAERVIETGRIPFGIGLVENAYEELAKIEVIGSADLARRDTELLAFSKQLAPALPVDDIDLLIVDEFGKDKSGTGLDTNVIGRRYLRGEREPEKPRIELIYLRRLTAASHGNALGMGLADIVHRDFADAIDFQATYENIVTSSFLERGKLPIVAETDRVAIDIALRALHTDVVDSVRAMHVRSTLELETIGVSQALLTEMEACVHTKPAGDTYSLVQDDSG